VPGGNRASVYAYPSELEHWLRNDHTEVRDESLPAIPAAEFEAEEGEEAEEEPARQAPGVMPAPAAVASPRSRLWRLAAGGMAAVLLVLSPMVYFSLAESPRSQPGTERLSDDPAARDLYLSGNFQLAQRTPRGLRRAVQLFTQSIANDPEFAAAYAGLAKAYALLVQYRVLPGDDAYPLARAAAERALKLDPDLPAAYAALGLTAFYGDRNFAESRRLLERAMQIDPQSAETFHWLALTTVLTGAFDEAMEAILRAQELDPHSRAILANKGQILYRSGQLDQAARLLDQFVESTPDYAAPHFYLTDIYMVQGRFQDALRHGLIAAGLTNNDAMRGVYEAAEAGYRRNGQAGLMEDMLKAECEFYRQGEISAYRVAKTLARLGRDEEAMGLLASSVTAKEPDALLLKIDPVFTRLRSDPRFADLLIGIGHTADYPAPSVALADSLPSPGTEAPR
jgi:tetratricopeptide (TPR) repeat protein